MKIDNIKVGEWFIWTDTDDGEEYKCQRDDSEIGYFGNSEQSGIGITDDSEATHTYIVLLKDCRKI